MKNVDIISARSKYVQLSELGSKFNLCFSGHLEIGNILIALDGVKRSLLVFETNKDPDQAYVIALNKVAAVTMKKSYGNIKPGELKRKGMDEFLTAIELQFEYRNKQEITVLPFYCDETHGRIELPRMERMARNWHVMLSKMVGSEKSEIVK